MFTVFRVLKVSSKRTIKRMYLFIFCPEKMCFRGRKWRSKSKKQHDWHSKQIILTPIHIFFCFLPPCVPRPDCDGVGPDVNLLLGRALSLLSEVLDISGPQLPPPPEGFSWTVGLRRGRSTVAADVPWLGCPEGDWWATKRCVHYLIFILLLPISH